MAKKQIKRKKRVVNRPSWKKHAKDLEVQLNGLKAEIRNKEERALAQAYRWKSSDGPILPKDMTEEHLRNAINYLIRRTTAEAGRVLYTSAMHEWFTGLHHLMSEAKRRGFQF